MIKSTPWLLAGVVSISTGANLYSLFQLEKSRYTHSILEETGEFTVSIPMGKNLSKELAFCGTKSGRDYDKFKECNLTPVAAQKIKTPIIKECCLHYECKVVYKQDIIPENLDKAIDEKFW